MKVSIQENREAKVKEFCRSDYRLRETLIEVFEQRLTSVRYDRFDEMVKDLFFDGRVSLSNGGEIKILTAAII